MKTHVRTKLGWSKLVLISVALAVVAMLSVLGLCFTNANADDTADPANAAEINFPVSILNSDLVKAGATCLTTGWVLDTPSKDFKKMGKFEHHTYYINDKEHQWVDNEECTARVTKEGLIITVAANEDGKYLYNSWKIMLEKDPGLSWYVFRGGKTEQIPLGKTFMLKSGPEYSFFYDEPQVFNVETNTSDAEGITGKALDFDKKSIEISGSLPQSFALNSKAIKGFAVYKPGQPYSLVLSYLDGHGDKSEFNIDVLGKFDPTANYCWTYNGKPIETDSTKPTEIDFTEKNMLFSFEKGGSPIPPEPITDFTVKGQVVDKDGKPIPNATVGFYNSEMDTDLEEPMVSALTDEDGYFVLEGCSTGTKDPESGLKITYTAKHYGMDEFPIDYEDIKSGVVTLTSKLELEPAIIDLYSDSPQHKSFTITEVRQEKGKEPEILFSRNLEYYGISELSSNGIDNPIFNISDNGVLVNTDDEGTTLTITPNGQDGYIFDNYVINDKTTYRVGDTVDIMQIVKEDSQAKINTNYVADTSKIAQTSDENIYAVVAIIAIVAAVGTLLVLRRRKLDL